MCTYWIPYYTPADKVCKGVYRGHSVLCGTVVIGHTRLVCPHIFLQVCAANYFYISNTIGMKLDIRKQHVVKMGKIYSLYRLV